MHFNGIFDYYSHIWEKNNMTVTWLLLTVSLVVPHAGLIYLHNCRLTGGGIGFGVKISYEAIWSLRFNLLISRKSKHLCDCIESCIESHSLHAPEMFSSVPTAKQEGESPKLLTKHSILVIAEFELYYIYTHTYALFFISELFLIHENHSEMNMDYRLFLFYNSLLTL